MKVDSETKKEIDQLVENLSPKARIPAGFWFWSQGMVLAWLRQNQKEKQHEDEQVKTARSRAKAK